MRGIREVEHHDPSAATGRLLAAAAGADDDVDELAAVHDDVRKLLKATLGQ